VSGESLALKVFFNLPVHGCGAGPPVPSPLTGFVLKMNLCGEHRCRSGNVCNYIVYVLHDSVQCTI